MSSALSSLLIDAGELLQHVSRVVHRAGPLHFGRSGANRYDDPARVYGVLYLGRDLPTALMESVFHKHQWLEDTKRSIALKEIQGRMVRAIGVMTDMRLADLTAPGVMAGYFGLNLEQLASRDYTHTQQVSALCSPSCGCRTTRRRCGSSTNTSTATVPPSLPVTATPRGTSRRECRSVW